MSSRKEDALRYIHASSGAGSVTLVCACGLCVIWEVDIFGLGAKKIITTRSWSLFQFENFADFTIGVTTRYNRNKSTIIKYSSWLTIARLRERWHERCRGGAQCSRRRGRSGSSSGGFVLLILVGFDHRWVQRGQRHLPVIEIIKVLIFVLCRGAVRKHLAHQIVHVDICLPVGPVHDGDVTARVDSEDLPQRHAHRAVWNRILFVCENDLETKNRSYVCKMKTKNCHAWKHSNKQTNINIKQTNKQKTHIKN